MEKKMTAAQKKKKDEILDAMKKTDFKKRYGDDWEDVMHATATKQAMSETKRETVKKSQASLNEGVLDMDDDDGWMAKNKLYQTAKYAIELHAMINDTDDLEPWVQDKITLANDYLSSVKHHLEYSGLEPEDQGDGIEAYADDQLPMDREIEERARDFFESIKSRVGR